MLVPGLNASGNVVSARFSSDERSTYLGAFYGTQIDILIATRSSRFEAFGVPMRVANVNGPDWDDFPSVTEDGLTLYMDSTRGGSSDIYTATRPTTMVDFSPAIKLPELSAYGEGAPYVTPDGKALYFHSARTGSFDVFRAEKRDGGFGEPKSVSINTTDTESVPVVSPGELTIYFSYGGGMRGPEGVWTATRTAPDAPFDPPFDLSELNYPYRAEPTWISSDGCRIYLKEQDQFGGFWAYMAERTP